MHPCISRNVNDCFPNLSSPLSVGEIASWTIITSRRFTLEAASMAARNASAGPSVFRISTATWLNRLVKKDKQMVDHPKLWVNNLVDGFLKQQLNQATDRWLVDHPKYKKKVDQPWINQPWVVKDFNHHMLCRYHMWQSNSLQGISSTKFPWFIIVTMMFMLFFRWDTVFSSLSKVCQNHIATVGG